MRAHISHRRMQQHDLLQDGCPARWPQGLRYEPEFLSPEEERSLLASITHVPFQHAQYRQFVARRRTVSYGAGYDFQQHARTPAPDIPSFLEHLRRRAAAWIGVDSTAFVQALISEYQPGTPLGWHRDVPDYEDVVAISLAAACRIRFRRYPWNPAERGDIVTLEPQPRSIYLLSGEARWKWQHSVPPVKELRYSITFRTPRKNRAPR